VTGGSAWESNPPKTALLPPNGFEGAASPVWQAVRSNLSVNQIVNRFLDSRRDGLSPSTISHYRGYLKSAKAVIGFDVSSQQITEFIKTRKCTSGGKHSYYAALRYFYRWIYSPKSGLGLSPADNPMLGVDAPKRAKIMLPSLTPEQVDYLIEQAGCVRDKAIISLFADSGLLLSELLNIHSHNIDWENRLIKVRCKGNKEALAPFGIRTDALLKEWFAGYSPNGGNIWGLKKWGMIDMLHRLRDRTGLPCNPHTFRRTFASILAKRGVDSLHIMRLGRWESISMVERYTRSVRFEDSMKFYAAIVS
jgi:site-specific recombinase XerD